MNSLRQHALDAWAEEQERRKQSERKKRKRRAKKIEEDIDDLLPRDVEGLRFERDLEDPQWEVLVSVTDTDGSTLRFTFDTEGDLSLIGVCPSCHQEAISRSIESVADLGELLETFAVSSSHDCKTKTN